VSPIYLVSYETFDVTAGILTTLKLRFQLACRTEDLVMFCVNISASNSSLFFTQSGEILKDDNDLFEASEMFVTFLNIRLGMEYSVHAHLLASDGALVGVQHQRIINVPLDICK